MEKAEVFYPSKGGCELMALPSFIHATKEERALVCNGCGTSGLGGWLVPDFMWGLRVTIVCDIHDWMYSKCESTEDEDYADYIFRKNLRRFIIAHSTGKFKRWIRLRCADLYFIGVALTYFTTSKKGT